MSGLARALLVGVWLTATQGAPTAAQETWLRGFEGTWGVDGAIGADAEIVLTVVREGSSLVLKVVARDRETVTRYDLSGADVTNQNLGRKALFRTRIDGQKLVTEIWQSEVTGPPARIETRYLESADLMVTELARTPGGQAFNRTRLRRKASQVQ